MHTGVGVYQHLSRLNRKKKLSMNQNKEDVVNEVVGELISLLSWQADKARDRKLRQTLASIDGMLIT